MDKVRMAIIGCGGISNAHVRGLAELDEVGVSNLEVVATCDLNGKAARERASQISEFQEKTPSTYTDLQEMLGQEQLDAVDICTEHRSHHSVALPCMESGLNVMVEKPLAITMRAGRMMIEAAEDQDVTLAVAENYRRNSENRAIHWALKTGKIGDPRMIFWQQLNYSLGSWGWRHDKMKAGGGWILDGGVHYADLFIYNLGPIEEVSAVTKTLEDTRYDSWPERKGSRPYTVEDLSLALISFESGASGVWTWTDVAPGEKLDQRVIYGVKGSVGWNNGLITETMNPRGQKTVSKEELIRWMLAEMDDQERDRVFPGGIGIRGDFKSTVAIELWDFARAILEGGEPEVDGEMGAKAQALPMAIFESSETGETVSMDEVMNLDLEVYQEEINRDLDLV